MYPFPLKTKSRCQQVFFSPIKEEALRVSTIGFGLCKVRPSNSGEASGSAHNPSVVLQVKYMSEHHWKVKDRTQSNTLNYLQSIIVIQHHHPHHPHSQPCAYTNIPYLFVCSQHPLCAPKSSASVN